MLHLSTTDNPDPSQHRRWWFNQIMRWDAEVPDDVVKQLWHNPQSLLAEGKKLQEKSRGTVVYLDRPVGPLVLKSLNWGTSGRTLRKWLSSTAARSNAIDSGRVTDLCRSAD